MFANHQFDVDAARRHGVQGFTATTYYSDLGGTAHRDPVQQQEVIQGRGPVVDALRARARRLWDAFSINHLLHKGVWVLAGNPAIRVGHRVSSQGAAPDDRAGSAYFDAREYERRTYYVERVVQDDVDGSHYFSHLALTRGQPEGRFIVAREPDPIGLGTREDLTRLSAPE